MGSTCRPASWASIALLLLDQRPGAAIQAHRGELLPAAIRPDELKRLRLAEVVPDEPAREDLHPAGMSIHRAATCWVSREAGRRRGGGGPVGVHGDKAGS